MHGQPSYCVTSHHPRARVHLTLYGNLTLCGQPVAANELPMGTEKPPFDRICVSCNNRRARISIMPHERTSLNG